LAIISRSIGAAAAGADIATLSSIINAASPLAIRR
jgi:hypothetical protein